VTSLNNLKEVKVLQVQKIWLSWVTPSVHFSLNSRDSASGKLITLPPLDSSDDTKVLRIIRLGNGRNLFKPKRRPANQFACYRLTFYSGQPYPHCTIHAFFVPSHRPSSLLLDWFESIFSFAVLFLELPSLQCPPSFSPSFAKIEAVTRRGNFIIDDRRS
jgi:hypothetical protein